MIELKGKYNTAKVFTDNVEQTAMSQIIEMCNLEEYAGETIRIMPDTHAGAGCTIGTTMTITDKICPNLTGVDIGCGMEVAFIHKDKSEINFDQLDEVIRKRVPSGFAIRGKSHVLSNKFKGIEDVIAPINTHRAYLSIGTLGGGNHFIELNEVGDGMVAVVIHSGSRNLGKQVAEHYQKVAYEHLVNLKGEKERIIAELKAQGRENEIHDALRGIKAPKIKKELAYLQGQAFKDYIHDMEIAQRYAATNRKAMMQEIIKGMDWGYDLIRVFTTIHNYIDIDNMILRKGAISAQAGEEVIIPINMRDGSIIAVGKGNPDWNFSGPHGAGRIMSRSKAKKNLKLEDFQSTMKDVWTTSVAESTLDEAPMVYKPIDEIMGNIQESVEIKQVIKPLYNFKAN
ncbi:tRNA splicing ligase [Bacillus phage vB_BmeM-Goe8]|uniref:3'-phosphate/5'-hydroxy nucleic acid ligase n=1 Tax=Bacillus phage vB_BmeM-Goe8 TaxID=2593638 RepID=A0A516KMZ0_9CAUD|nr:tRNA splicing ligase [Bacillus phage vB_BmeM-Goe8]QDP42945.1 tRNA-splicing ligase [Bacillus phage vB_BmeM-Goe8]